MLVVTRRPGERLLVGTDVEMVILGVEGGHVKIGISAPADVRVLRGELVDEVGAENRQAAKAHGSRLMATLGTPRP